MFCACNKRVVSRQNLRVQRSRGLFHTLRFDRTKINRRHGAVNFGRLFRIVRAEKNRLRPVWWLQLLLSVYHQRLTDKTRMALFFTILSSCVKRAFIVFEMDYANHPCGKKPSRYRYEIEPLFYHTHWFRTYDQNVLFCSGIWETRELAYGTITVLPSSMSSRRSSIYHFFFFSWICFFLFVLVLFVTPWLKKNLLTSRGASNPHSVPTCIKLNSYKQ